MSGKCAQRFHVIDDTVPNALGGDRIVL